MPSQENSEYPENWRVSSRDQKCSILRKPVVVWLSSWSDHAEIVLVVTLKQTIQSPVRGAPWVSFEERVIGMTNIKVGTVFSSQQKLQGQSRNGFIGRPTKRMRGDDYVEKRQ